MELKINSIPIILLAILLGFMWGAKTERDIQAVMALEATPPSTITLEPTLAPTIIPIVSTPKPTVEPTPRPTVEPIKSEIYKATAYCACVKCCGKSDGITASGKKAKEGITIAADWKVLPNGTKVEIKGIGTRTVQDRGGAIKGKRIDIYFDSHTDALAFGVQDVLVTVKEDGK